MLVGSGAVEDDFLVFRESTDPRFKVVQGNGPLQAHGPESFIAVIGADEEAITGFHSWINFFRGNAQIYCHEWLPSSSLN
jgi:hypothetical protein